MKVRYGAMAGSMPTPSLSSAPRRARRKRAAAATRAAIAVGLACDIITTHVRCSWFLPRRYNLQEWTMRNCARRKWTMTQWEILDAVAARAAVPVTTTAV